MLIYGDHTCERDPRARLGEIEARLAGNHDALVGAFIAASEVAQGVADAEYAARGNDARSATTDLLMQLLVALARAIDASWARRAPDLAPARALLRQLADVQLPATVHTKRGEGYAYYALYPEAYLAAARRAGRIDHVIGVRSIGCGLAALVAAATGAPLPATVRPVGDPFRRELHVSPALVEEWLHPRGATIAIVDEGPGMSGSSFGAVADLLESHGVATGQLVCFPGHGGPLGPAASPHHRERWSRVRRHVVTLDDLLRDRIPGWIAALVGPLTEPLVELSAGEWRRQHYASEDDWPPVVAQQERIKYLARTRSGTWLARFVGLGEAGEHALELARETSAAGFTPEVAGLCHGFLVERWLDATPLDRHVVDRDRLVARVGDYLALRARRHGPVGACGDELIVMVRRNVTLGIDADTAARVTPHQVPAGLRPVQIDGKLHAWEWLVARDGAIVKADGYDHHAAHDLVGCQDIAWDVAGAAVELELAPAEEQRLARLAGADPAHVQFMRPCYLAFQLGRATMAAAASEPAEATRLRAAAARYARAITSRC